MRNVTHSFQALHLFFMGFLFLSLTQAASCEIFSGEVGTPHKR
jgi:hypothetical protein